MTDNVAKPGSVAQPIVPAIETAFERKVLTIQDGKLHTSSGPSVGTSGSTLGTCRAEAIAKPPVTSPIETVKAELAEVQRAWARYQGTRDRDAVYVYLTAVDRLISQWKIQRRVEKSCRLALRLRNKPVSIRLEPFAVVILCTSDERKLDAKARSKWSRVLRVAEKLNRRGEPLRIFVKGQGGINRCAARFRESG